MKTPRQNSHVDYDFFLIWNNQEKEYTDHAKDKSEKDIST